MKPIRNKNLIHRLSFQVRFQIKQILVARSYPGKLMKESENVLKNALILIPIYNPFNFFYDISHDNESYQ